MSIVNWRVSAVNSDLFLSCLFQQIGGDLLCRLCGIVAAHDIIADIDRGILVGRFSGGSPAPSGEFSGVAKNGFLIENGKLKGAISETMISGNLAEMLNNLVEVSSDVLNDGGLVVPYMVFDGITVSGK